MAGATALCEMLVQNAAQSPTGGAADVGGDEDDFGGDGTYGCRGLRALAGWAAVRTSLCEQMSHGVGAALKGGDAGRVQD